MKDIFVKFIVAFLCIASVFVIKILNLPTLITALFVAIVAGMLIFALAGGFSKIISAGKPSN